MDAATNDMFDTGKPRYPRFVFGIRKRGDRGYTKSVRQISYAWFNTTAGEDRYDVQLKPFCGNLKCIHPDHLMALRTRKKRSISETTTTTPPKKKTKKKKQKVIIEGEQSDTDSCLLTPTASSDLDLDEYLENVRCFNQAKEASRCQW